MMKLFRAVRRAAAAATYLGLLGAFVGCLVGALLTGVVASVRGPGSSIMGYALFGGLGMGVLVGLGAGLFGGPGKPAKRQDVESRRSAISGAIAAGTACAMIGAYHGWQIKREPLVFDSAALEGFLVGVTMGVFVGSIVGSALGVIVSAVWGTVGEVTDFFDDDSAPEAAYPVKPDPKGPAA